MDKNSTSASTSKAPKNEVIPMWKLNTFLQKHVITKVQEGEKYEVLAEKIENLRRSSEQLLKDAVGADPEVASNLVVNPDSDDTRCTAATAPGVVFAHPEERLQHYKSDWHRWNLKLRSNGIQPISKEAFEQLQKAGDEEDFSLDLLDNTTIDGHKDESSSEEEKEEEHSVFGKKGAAKIDFITEDGLNVCKRLNRREEWADVMGTADSEGAASQGETKD